MDHHGHNHGGDGPLWYQRLLFALTIGLIILFILVMFGLRSGWLR